MNVMTTMKLLCLCLVSTSTVHASSCIEDIDCGWNSVCDQNQKLCQCLPNYTLSYNNIDCVNTLCEDSDCLQCTNVDVCQRCVDYIEDNTGRCLRKCANDYYLFVEGDHLGKVCPERMPNRLDWLYLAVVIGIVSGIVLVVLDSACLYWRIHTDRKQKLRLKILERERLDGSQRSNYGSQDFGCANAAHFVEDTTLPQGDYRPLLEKVTPHIDSLHKARVKQKQLLPGDPQLPVYNDILLKKERNRRTTIYQAFGRTRDEREPRSRDQEGTPEIEGAAALEAATDYENEDLCQLRAYIAIGHAACNNEDDYQAERVFREGIALAKSMHFEDFRLEKAKRLLWVDLYHCLSVLKLCQNKMIQSVEEMHEAVRLTEYSHSGVIVRMWQCVTVLKKWLNIAHNIQEHTEALHKYVTKTCTVAEDWLRQGNYDAVEMESLPVISVLEALWGAGDLAFVTEDKLRHVYVLHGLALCYMFQDAHAVEYFSKKAFDYGGFEDSESIRLALRINMKNGDVQKVLRYAAERAKVSPEDDQLKKVMDKLTTVRTEQATPRCSNDSNKGCSNDSNKGCSNDSKKRSRTSKKGQSGAVTRRKKKPKVKFFSRRGYDPVDQSTTEHEHCFTSRSGKGSTIGVTHATPATTATTTEMKAPASPSVKTFEIISKKYEIRLACDECAREKNNVTGHECREEMLLLKKKNESVSQAEWVHVRSRPPSWNRSEGRPHNDYEGELWKNDVDIRSVVRDMRFCSRLRAMYVVSKLTLDQQYVFVCKTCFDMDPDRPITKTPHRPVCKRGHPWENMVCLFEEAENGAKTYSEPTIDNVATAHDLVEECARSKQRKIYERNRPEQSESSTDNEPYQTISESSSLENDIGTCTVYDMCDEDILTRDNDQDDDTLEIIYQGGDVYYKVHVEHELDKLLRDKPDRYKRCTLRLTGRHSAVCTPEVAAGNLSKIPIKGRTNCGPTFDGDEVVVEMIRTKELDKESTVLSGRVAGVLGGCVKRCSHLFVCNVDEYLSCLMVPRCGTAPKIHVLDSYLREKYDNIRNQLVTVYEKMDGNFQRKRIEPERLNPKDRQSRLFVVRYIKWNTKFMYPLGCVVKVIEPGRDLKSGQRILNLQYQVQQQLPTDVFSHAESVHASDVPGGRRDMRGEYTFTIDPPGCKDIDDALSVRKCAMNGSEVYEVYVHIADVTHYVKPSDPIDIESRRRGTTFYQEVGYSAFHILPERLSEDMCSLLPGKDRVALSVRLTLDNDGNLLEQIPKVARTVINSNVQLTYAEVHEMLSSTGQNKDNEVDDNLRRRLIWLHDLSQRCRKKRLQDTRFYTQYNGLFEDDDQAAEVHELIEEFMFLANKEVAKFLVAKFPDCTPLRSQENPKDDDLRSWQTTHATVARRTFYFQSFNELLAACDEGKDGDFPLLVDTARGLREAVQAGDIARATTLVSSEQLHPEFALLFPSWYGIQEKSEYTRSGNGTSCRHFTLREDVYTHFTSPIRRYFDTIVHRLVKAAIDGQPCPYIRDEIDQLCRHLNYKMTQQKQHDNDLKSLKAVCTLHSAAQFLPGVVEQIDEGHFSMYLPHLRLRKDVKYGLLGVRKALTAERVGDSPPDDVTLLWSRKIFDAGGCPTHPRTGYAVNESLRLATDAHVVRVPRDKWNDVRRAIVASDTETVLPAVSDMLSDARSSSNELIPEVTSEMKMGEMLWRKACDFQLSLKRNDTLMFQVGAELVRGLLEPSIRLVNLTRQLDLCVEHMDQPVKCFAETAVLHSKKKYTNIEEYQKIWLPMLAMEAAEGAVKEGDPTVVHNVKVVIRREGNKLSGSFKLPKAFCKVRQIALIENMKQDEVATDSYLCIRCAAVPGQVAEHQSRNVWVSHALTQNACIINEDDDDDDDGEIYLEFRVQQSNTDPPRAMLKNKHGVSCTVELMPKMNTDRRKEDAVRDLRETTELCKAIVLAKPVPKPDPNLERLCPENLQVDTVRSSALIYLPQSNESQLRAIRAGLTGNFTVIQGPPGTGKTQTAVKLAYWFTEMNRKRDSGSGETTRRQVLYCGPSNGAVDVAAKQLHECFGNKAPKILRIYSEELERQVFPIPREAPVRIGHGRRFELIGRDDQKKVALHYLIRKPGNKFSEKITKYDQLFRENMDSHYNVDDKEIEKYSKLITDAAIHEIPQYDIVLCTCSHSASPRITRAANVVQCIIDECGMCTEPESLVPLTSHKPQQVVLIGDHKQLRPIVKQPTAKELGLEISLFERYEKKAILLDMQYRMHPAICEFPSQQFYGGWLKTADGFNARLNFGDYPKRSKRRLQAMWPNGQRPVVFCHVEGAEQSLVISSSDGNEASKSNMAERDHAVRIFAHLVNDCEVPQNKVTVLSQYRAQCSEITRNMEEVYGFKRPNVSTVIASQGDEWDYVILSTVRSMPQHEIDKRPTTGWLKVNLGFIMDAHQINVGLTRAKKGLIIIGNQHVLRCSSMWRELMDEYRANGCLVEVSAFPRTQQF